MTDKELAAIKARADAATLGPWIAKERAYDWLIESRQGVIARVDPYPGVGAEFIAHAREDIPALLAEVEAWREIGRILARGFTLAFDEMRNAYVCALCDAEVTGDFGTDVDRDTAGWHERHITHTADCPVMKARALLGMGEGEAQS